MKTIDKVKRHKAVEEIWKLHRRYDIGPARSEIEQAYDAGWNDRDAEDQTKVASASDNENRLQLPVSPKRMFSLNLSVHADTEQDLRALLHEISREIMEGHRECIAMGGSSVGGRWKLTVDPEMTHDRYFEMSDAYLSKIREVEKSL